MGDESFFDISALQPSRNVISSSWMAQNQMNYVQPQQTETINQISNINDGQNASGLFSNGPNRQGGNDHEGSTIDTWNPMDEDFSCSTFNSYKNFDVLNAEHPKNKSPEKSVQQSLENRAEEIRLYVGNIPLSITKEGIKNLFLSVGEVKSCSVLPPKDPSYDNKYGFVEFCSWRDATKAIEMYDGFYVGCEKNLKVKVAYRRRDDDDYYAIKDGDHSSSDSAAQDSATHNPHPPFNDNCSFDDEDHEVKNDQKFSNTSQNCPVKINHINNEQSLGMPPATELNNSEDNLPSKTRHEPPASPRAKLPCTFCEKLCTQRCSACKAPYCSRKCQKNDRARHKLTCIYQANIPKPVNPSIPEPAPAAVSEPLPEPEYEYNFDCIDISTDTAPTPRKEIAKDETKNAMASKENNVLDSGYTSPKEDTGVSKANEPHSDEVNPDTGMVKNQPEVLHADMPGAQQSLDKEFVAYVTAVSFANTIWAVVRTSNYPRFCDMTVQMAEITEENLEKITAVNIGTLCLARFSLDNCWYRSRILQGNADQVEVIFVDYGNKEWKNMHDVYQLPPGFGDVPPQAQQFSLHGVTVEDHSEIGNRLVELLDGMVTGKTFVFEMVYSALGCIPEVILRDPDAQESVNQQMMNYLYQETSIVGGKLVQSNDGMTASGNISPNHSMANCNDPKTSYASNQEPNIHKRYKASEVPSDILPSTKQFDIFVCHFVSPNSFWIWFLDTAKELLQQLSLILSETYDQSTYLEYLPIVGELIVAKFTDGVWYRAEVDCINNDSTLKVTFIDFGNSEDVTLFDTRMITAPLAVIPKLANKCALYGMEETRNWSAACNLFCSEIMLNKRGLALVQSKRQDSLVLRVDVEINGVMKSVVNEIVRQGYFTFGGLPALDFGGVHSSMPPEKISLNKESVRVCHPFASDNKHVLPCNESLLPFKKEIRPSNQHVAPSSQAVVTSSQLVIPSCQPVIPSSQPVIPSSQPVIPSSQPVTPSSQPVIPSSQPVIPSSQPGIPSSQPGIPSSQPGIPSSQPVIPSSQPVIPSSQPGIPSSQPGIPSSQPGIPSSQPVIPSSQPVIPSSQPVIPSSQPVIPSSQPVIPSSQTFIPSSQPVIPSSQPVIPSSQPVIPSSQPGIPSSQPVIPFSQPIIPFSQPIIPSSQPVIPSSQPVIPSIGQKVEPAYKTMLPLPSAPSTPFNVVVNDVLSADKFYAQMIEPDLVNQLKKCVRELNEHVTKYHPPKVENAAVGHLGCARFFKDNVWYRAQILKVNDDNYKVRFIDFGNIQDVHPNEFLKAPESFYRLAPQALCCRLGTAKNQIWGQNSRCVMETLTLNKQLLCTVIGGTSWPQYAVKLQSTDGDEVIDIAEELNKGMASYRPLRTTSHSSNPPSPPVSSSPPPCPMKTPSPLPASTPLPQFSSNERQNKVFSEKVLNSAIFASDIGEVGRTYEVYVSNVYHPTYFWVQDAKNVENIQRLQEELNSHYNNSSFPPFKPLLHSFCVYISHNQCYRVFVRHATSKGLQVHFVDFGHQIVADEKGFRPLDEKFCSQPFGAILCSMREVKPIDGKLWSDEAIKYFKDKIKFHRVTIRVYFNSKARLFVDMFDPDSSEERLLSTALVANGMAKALIPKRPPTGQNEEECALPYLDSDTAINEINAITAFGKISSLGDIGDVRGKSSVEKQAPSFDSNFQVPSQNPVSSTNSTLRSGSEVETRPSQNERSGLDCKAPGSSLNPISTNGTSPDFRYSRNPDSINTTFEIPKVGGEGVTSLIPVVIPLEKELEVFVSWVDSPDSFCVQLAVKETVQQYAAMGEELHRMCESSSESILNAKVGACYASKFAGDWYRCKIEALVGNGFARVFYVDFGNRDDVAVAKLKPLTDKFLVLPAQALQCALADVRPRKGGWVPQTVQWLTACMLNKTLVAAVVKTVGDVLHVRVYDNSNPAKVSINSLMASLESERV